MKKIRLAFLRCDGHAYTYGPLLAPVDPMVYARNFHAEYYFMIDAYRPDRLKMPVVPGIEIVKVWDRNPQAAQGIVDMFFDKPRACATVAEMTEEVDAAFINNCNGDGGDHLELASPFLKKGIPTFIDKPFASKLRDAVATVELAEEYRAPLMSSSILGYAREVRQLKGRFAELSGEVRRGIVNGVGFRAGLGGIIHGLSLGHAVFGEGVEWVECMGEGPLQYLLMHYADSREVLVNNAEPDEWDEFLCDVYSQSTGCPPELAHIRSNPIGEFQFVWGALNVAREFRKMVLTRKPPMPYSRLTELIAIVEAGWQAQRTRNRVHLKDLAGWKGK